MDMQPRTSADIDRHGHGQGESSCVFQIGPCPLSPEEVEEALRDAERDRRYEEQIAARARYLELFPDVARCAVNRADNWGSPFRLLAGGHGVAKHAVQLERGRGMRVIELALLADFLAVVAFFLPNSRLAHTHTLLSESISQVGGRVEHSRVNGQPVPVIRGRALATVNISPRLLQSPQLARG